MPRSIYSRRILLLALLVVVAGVVRLTVAGRLTLDKDEIFTLAMATGHSIEHSAAAARPELGDFVQVSRAVPARHYWQYVEHQPGNGPGRVLRAVRRSDIHPPGYYLLVHWWTRIFGTGDFAVRMLSVILGTATVPLTYMLLRRLSGASPAMLGAVLVAFAPLSVYHGTYARMYPLLLVLCLLTALATLQLHRKGLQPAIALWWIASSAAGFLTHYFFAFAWVGMFTWLLLHPHRLKRSHALTLAGGVFLAILPWYSLLPELLSTWRVSNGWQQIKPRGFSYPGAQVRIPLRYFLEGGDWSYGRSWRDAVLAAVVAAAGAGSLLRRRSRLFRPGARLLWLWLISVSGGLLVFDLVRGTYLEVWSRFSFAGIGAALGLLALALADNKAVVRKTLLIAMVALWGGALARLNTMPARLARRTFDAEGAKLSTVPAEKTVVLVTSIPSGVIAVARYLPGETMMADWVRALRTRTVPGDVDALTGDAARISVVGSLRGHDALLLYLSRKGEPAPPQPPQR